MPKPFKLSTTFCYSILLHAGIVLILIISLDFNTSNLVTENSTHAPNPFIHAMLVNASTPAPISHPLTVPAMPPTPKLPPPIQPKLASPTPSLPPKPMPLSASTIRITQKNKQKQVVAQNLLADLAADIKQSRKKKQETFTKKNLEAAFQTELAQLHEKSQQQGVSPSKASQGKVDKYKALILQTISQHWLIPPHTNKKLTAELLIRLAPTGTVLDVQIIKSSGNNEIDRSARAAVFKASPLPVPNEEDAFASFRQFVLRVRPEEYV